MKHKVLSLILACMPVLTCHAEKVLCVVLYNTEGKTTFSLNQRPVVSFTDTDVKLSCNKTEVLYSLDNYLKLTIEEVDTETSVTEVDNDIFTVNNDEISVRGVECLALYSIDGKFIASGKADGEGWVRITTSQLRKGSYIVNTGNKSFKFIKK